MTISVTLSKPTGDVEKLLAMAATVGVYLERGNDTFSDAYGMRYMVLSEDSGTCALIGRTKGNERPNIYISDQVKYRGRTYNVTEIADSAFKGDMHLETVCFPSTLRRIGAGAFKECKNMISADIPNGVTYIGPTAFWWCVKLESVRLPNSIRRIPKRNGSMPPVVATGAITPSIAVAAG